MRRTGPARQIACPPGRGNGIEQAPQGSASVLCGCRGTLRPAPRRARQCRAAARRGRTCRIALELDAEGFKYPWRIPLRQRPSGQRRHGRRVKAAGQHGAKRHRHVQLPADGIIKLLPHIPGGLLEGVRCGSLTSCQYRRRVTPDAEKVSRWAGGTSCSPASGVSPGRASRGWSTMGSISMSSRAWKRGLAMIPFGSEAKRTRPGTRSSRAVFSHAVAAEHEGTRPAIPDREAKDAVGLLDEAVAPEDVSLTRSSATEPVRTAPPALSISPSSSRPL